MWHFVSPKIVFGESALSSVEDISISEKVGRKQPFWCSDALIA